MDTITISTRIEANIEQAWECFTSMEHIPGWAFATPDWEATPIVNELEPGGQFKTVMGAKDGSFSFDFEGVYAVVEPHSLIEYDLSDGRHVKTAFEETTEGIVVTQTFEPESENPIEMQRDGWQAFLNNFKAYVEAQTSII